ncbi:unnamed protein product [Pocillopora meandrina]|uniref:Transcription elongation factor A N-terminal and central domain-containing protein 2 n=1 Tax=Pocillopora meandrina TaxID=46732 RepID=A0AAU9WZ87_9CNID|nr:unnamed protein product [Pocillopora meandrina]
MDKFVIRTKRSPKPERKITETANRKKQSTIESLASVVVVEEIQRLKLELENEVSTPETILSALKVLGKKNLSKEVLMSTKVGHTVNRLRRQGSTEEIRQQAKVVFRRWRQFVTDLEKEKPLIEVHCDKKTEALRGKGRQLIADALQMTPLENLPELIERTVFHTYGRLINNTYKRKMRSLVFILKHRDSIREKVVTGEISVKKLVSSSVEQLT